MKKRWRARRLRHLRRLLRESSVWDHVLRGVVVTQVDPDSAAAEAGLERGDVIEEVNRKHVASVDEFQNPLREASGRGVLLLVSRGGATSYVAISPR